MPERSAGAPRDRRGTRRHGHRCPQHTDRAAIGEAAQQFIANSPDGTPGLWLAVWDHVPIGSITKEVFATTGLEQVAAVRLKLVHTVRQFDPALARRYP